MARIHSVGFYCALIVGLFVAAQGPILLPFWMGSTIDTLSLSESQGGWLATFQLGTSALTTIASASLLTRINKHWAFVAALSCAALGNGLSILSVNADSLPLLFPCRMLTGFGEGLLVAIVTGLAAETAKPIRAFALMNGVGALLMALIFLTSPYLIVPYGASAIYAMMLVSALLTLPLAIQLKIASHAALPASAQPHRPLAFSKHSWLGLLMFGLFACVNGGTFAFAQRIGINAVGLDLERIGAIIAVAAVLLVSGPWLANFLGDRLGQTLPILSCTVLYSLIALGFAFTSSEWLFLLAVLGHAVVSGFAGTFFSAFLVMLDASGRAVSAAPGFASIGMAIGPGIMASAIPHLPGYQAIGWVALSLLLVAAAGFMKLTLAVDRMAAGRPNALKSVQTP